MRTLIRISPIVIVLLLPGAALSAPRTNADTPSRFARLCEAGSRELAGGPTDQYRRALTLSEAQRSELDALAGAVGKAAQDIKTACSSEIAPSAPGRLAAMQARLEAMITAVATVRAPLEKFYGLLNDEQREQAIAIGQRQGARQSLLEADCGAGQAGVVEWPAADVERAVRPSDAQRASLTVLEAAVAKSGEAAKGSCATDTLLTPTARLAAVGARLDVWLASVKAVREPLGDFYATLSDDQKTAFDAISQSPSAAVDQSSKTKPAMAVHHHHFISAGYIIHRILHSF